MLVWSGYLVKVKGDRSKKPMIFGSRWVITWFFIWMIEKSS
ncbi:hypothetical protein [Lacticaseibacillus porcinae]|nr:hypothetical protein [Lacticaseibacillus porcinae]